MANALTAAATAQANGHDDARDAWLDFWASRPLPILESTRAGLVAMAGRADSVRTDELVELAMRDPLLIAHVLRQINQRPRGSMSSDVIAIENVILLMGLESFIVKFAKLPSIESLLLPKHPSHYYGLLRDIATARLAARLARDFAQQRYDAKLDEIYTTALLAGLPRMLRYLEVGLADKAPATRLDKVALPLFARWRLPEAFSSLLDDDGASSQRSSLQRAAVRLANCLQLGWWDTQIDEDLQLVASTLNVDQAVIWQMVVGLMLQFARQDWPYAHILPPARWLPMQPGEWPKPPAAKPVEPAKPGLVDILRELQKAGLSGASFNQIMGLAIRAHSEGIGLKRLMFGLLIPGQNALKTRYVVGVAEGDPLRAFHVDLGTPHLFTRLLQKPQSVWLNADNRKQFEALLPRGLRQAVGEGDFFAMSLFVEDKPVGLFFADNHGASLGDKHYEAFKQVCRTTGLCLSQQAKRLALGQ